jgi:hypothetical protein
VKLPPAPVIKPRPAPVRAPKPAIIKAPVKAVAKAVAAPVLPPASSAFSTKKIARKVSDLLA